MLHNDRIVSNKQHNSRVRYIIYNSFHTVIVKEEIKMYIKLGYNYDDIFILVPSIKKIKSRKRSPLNLLANSLTQLDIPLYISKSESTSVCREKEMKGKLAFLTFHQSKGLERKIIIVYNFDNSYFTYFNTSADPLVCPNELYVATTRTLEHLTLLHDHKQLHLPFIDRDKIPQYTTFINYGLHEIKEYVPPLTNLAVTELTSYLSFDILEKLMKYIDITTVTEHEKKIDIPLGTQQDNYYESISDITGTAIPLYFEFKEKGKSSVLKDFTDTDGSAKLLRLTTQELCKNDNLYYRMNQIQNYNWLSNKNLQLAYDRMKTHIGSNPHFEIPVSYKEELYGCIDCMDDTAIWEFKCVDNITREHILQLSLYMLMSMKLFSNKKYYILNILTNEKILLTSDIKRLSMMYSVLKEYKYNSNIGILSDKDLIESYNI
jgi:hypothetical protein